MATEVKRQTISLTKEMEARLDRIKQAKYYKTSQSKMIQDVICLGLDVIEKQIQTEKETQY